MDLAESEGWAIISAHLSTAHENPTLLLAFALPVVFLLIGLTAKAHGRLRPTSFTSGVMFAGSNPDAWGSPEPIIHACLYYDKCPTREGLEAAAKLMMDFGNYRGTVVQTGSWPRRTWGWKEISVYVPDTISFIQVDGAKAAHEAVERIMIEDLPKVDSRGDPLPLWHINVIENTAQGGESVVLVRNHHVIGDGVSLIGVIDHVMFTPEGEPLDVSGALKELKGGSGARPKKPSVFSLMGKALSGLVQVALVGVSPFDSKVSLNGPSEEKLKFGPRCFVHFPNVPLDLVKKLKDAAGVTVNDIMMCVTSGALRRHLTHRGTTPPGPLKLRALLPIAMARKITREQRFDEGLENVWGFASADMCVGISDIKERLRAIEGVTTGLKGSLVPWVQLGLQNNLLPFVPTSVCKQLAGDVFGRHSVVFSNVPGPPMPVAFGGQVIKRMQMLFPNIIMQIGILSYQGSLMMNCVADARSCTPSELRAAFLAELRATCDAFGVDAPAELQGIEAQCADLDAGRPLAA